ncbi:50S ribosomal protein L3 [Nanobdella aerobiophila]|uniref:50S ribosomal protein L3 n=1 Tax=Nanobdella aerobiophila TaxID=2586965 RepID=A0A915SZN6_9ARCH|nr:50S ribosomal protein L3 [Nanobdella aerobiophila]BBL45364.1 50S ribosomal protein L3 [Nanobdella aerobiophila]
MPQHGHHRPRRVSMQFWPRVRSSRIYPRIKTWPQVEQTSILAFAGYKVGMTHILTNDNAFMPVTVLEVPALRVFGMRLYKKDINKGYNVLTDLIGDFDDNLKKKIKTIRSNNNIEENIKRVEEKINEISLIKLLVYTQPWLTTIKKKKPELFEIPIGGNNIKEIFNYGKNLLGKEINIDNVFKEGEYVDTIGVTKGKGFTGEVKRFGTKIQPREYKVSKSARQTHARGARGMRRIFPTTPMPGQYGFFRRTEYNKLILKISDNINEINPKSGWPHYGIIKNKYILIKGSVQGPSKRLIILRKAIREKKIKEKIGIGYISLMPKN